MTEADWNNCTDPQKMLAFLRGKVSERKLRLFGCAACRHVWPLFTDARSRQAVEVVERYADGLASGAEMAAAQQAASEAHDLAIGPASDAPRRHRSRAGRCTSWAAYDLTNVPTSRQRLDFVWAAVAEATAYVLDAERGRCRANQRAGAMLLRDLCNPFRSVTLDPSWLTPNVLALARVLYEDRRFEDLPVLADALEEAGCTNQELLRHLREQGQAHVRGCWCIDQVRGKE